MIHFKNLKDPFETKNKSLKYLSDTNAKFKGPTYAFGLYLILNTITYYPINMAKVLDVLNPKNKSLYGHQKIRLILQTKIRAVHNLLTPQAIHKISKDPYIFYLLATPMIAS
jgi:hypothetical protein